MRRSSPPDYVRARLERTAALVRERRLAGYAAARRSASEHAAQRARFEAAAKVIDVAHDSDALREAQAVIDAAPNDRQGALALRRSA